MISQLSAKYQFCTIHTADTTDGKVTNQALLSIESEKVYRLYPPRYGQHFIHIQKGGRMKLVYMTEILNINDVFY